jgi:hypothetical protein
MSREEMINKTVFDVPFRPDSNKWSEDGMIAILAGPSIQIYAQTFGDLFYRARWIQLENARENEGNDIPASSGGNELIEWMKAATETDINGPGKCTLDPVFLKVLWTPAGLKIGSSSFLTALLSDGSVLLFAMTGASQNDHLISKDVRQYNVHLFSSSIAVDLSLRFTEWLQIYMIGLNYDRIDQHVITEIAIYPNLLTFKNLQYGESNCILMATGSSHGLINLWILQDKVDGLSAHCISWVKLTSPLSDSSNSVDSLEDSFSISSMQFVPAINKKNGNNMDSFSTCLVCGTSEGYFMTFDIDSMTADNVHGTTSTNSNFDDQNKNINEEKLPALSISDPKHSYRPFRLPIDTIIHVNKNEGKRNICDDAIDNHLKYPAFYLRSGINLIYLDLNTNKSQIVESCHVNVISSLCSIETREYTRGENGGELVLTCSLDGGILLCHQPLNSDSIDIHDTISISDNNVDEDIKKKKAKFQANISTSHDRNIFDESVKINDDNVVNLSVIQLISLPRDNGISELPSYIDMTLDPLQLVMSITQIVAGNTKDSRDVSAEHVYIFTFTYECIELLYIQNGRIRTYGHLYVHKMEERKNGHLCVRTYVCTCCRPSST